MVTEIDYTFAQCMFQVPKRVRLWPWNHRLNLYRPGCREYCRHVHRPLYLPWLLGEGIATRQTRRQHRQHGTRKETDHRQDRCTNVSNLVGVLRHTHFFTLHDDGMLTYAPDYFGSHGQRNPTSIGYRQSSPKAFSVVAICSYSPVLDSTSRTAMVRCTVLRLGHLVHSSAISGPSAFPCSSFRYTKSSVWIGPRHCWASYRWPCCPYLLHFLGTANVYGGGVSTVLENRIHAIHCGSCPLDVEAVSSPNTGVSVGRLNRSSPLLQQTIALVLQPKRPAAPGHLGR